MDALLNTPLPQPWTMASTQDGRIYFINDVLKITTWLHPLRSQTVQSGHFSDQYIPDHCEKDFNEEFQTYYIDHISKSTSWVIPTQKALVSLAETKKETRRAASPSPFKRSNSDKRRSLKQKAPDARRNPNSVVVTRDWIYRQEGGPGPLKSWKKRWCVLADLCLFVYKGPEEGPLLSSILLPSYNITPCPKDNHKYVFKVGHENVKSTYFSCESGGEAEGWIGVMRLASLAVHPSEEDNGGGGDNGGGDNNVGGNGVDNVGDINAGVVDNMSNINNNNKGYNGNNLVENKKKYKNIEDMNKNNVLNKNVYNNNNNSNNNMNQNINNTNSNDNNIPKTNTKTQYNIKTGSNNDMSRNPLQNQENIVIGNPQNYQLQQNHSQQNYPQSQQQHQQQHFQNHSTPGFGVKPSRTPPPIYNVGTNNNYNLNNNLNNNLKNCLNINPANNLQNLPNEQKNQNQKLPTKTPQLNINNNPSNNPLKMNSIHPGQTLVDWSEDLDSSRVIERYELDTSSVANVSVDILSKSQLNHPVEEVDGYNIKNLNVSGVGNHNNNNNNNSINNNNNRNDNIISGSGSGLNNISMKDRNEGGLKAQKEMAGEIINSRDVSVKSGRVSAENLKKIPGLERNSLKSGVIYPGVANMTGHQSQNSESFERVKEWTESQKRFYGENPESGVSNDFVDYNKPIINEVGRDVSNDLYVKDSSKLNQISNHVNVEGHDRKKVRGIQPFQENNGFKASLGYNDGYNDNSVVVNKDNTTEQGKQNLNDLSSDLKNNGDLVGMTSSLYGSNKTGDILDTLVKLRRAQNRLHEHSYNLIALSFKMPLQNDLSHQRQLLDKQIDDSSKAIMKLESCLQLKENNLSDDDLINKQQLQTQNNQLNTDPINRVQTQKDYNALPGRINLENDSKNEKILKVIPVKVNTNHDGLPQKKAMISPKPLPNSIQPSFLSPSQSSFQPPSQKINPSLQQEIKSPPQHQQQFSPISHLNNIDTDILRNKNIDPNTNQKSFISTNQQTLNQHNGINSNQQSLLNSNQPSFINANLTHQHPPSTYIETNLDLLKSRNIAAANKDPQMKLPSNFCPPIQKVGAQMDTETNGIANIGVRNKGLEKNGYMEDLIKRSLKTKTSNNFNSTSTIPNNSQVNDVSRGFNNYKGYVKGDNLESTPHDKNITSNKGHYYQSPENPNPYQQQQNPLQQQLIKNQQNQPQNQQNINFKPYQPKSYSNQQQNDQLNQQNTFNQQSYHHKYLIQQHSQPTSQPSSQQTFQPNQMNEIQAFQNINTFKTHDQVVATNSFPNNNNFVDHNNNKNISLNDKYMNNNDTNYIINDKINPSLNNRSIHNSNSFNNSQQNYNKVNNNINNYNNNNTNTQPMHNQTSNHTNTPSETPKQHIVRSFEPKPSQASPMAHIQDHPKDTMVRSDWTPMKASRSFQDLKKQCEEEEKEDNAVGGGDDDGVIRGGLKNRRHIRRLSGIFTPRPFYKSNPSLSGDNVGGGGDRVDDTGSGIGGSLVGDRETENKRIDSGFGGKFNERESETIMNNAGYGENENRLNNSLKDRNMGGYGGSYIDANIGGGRSGRNGSGGIDDMSRDFGNNVNSKVNAYGSGSEGVSKYGGNGGNNNGGGYDGGGGNIEKWLNKRNEKIQNLWNSKTTSNPNPLLYSPKNEQFELNAVNSYKNVNDNDRFQGDMNGNGAQYFNDRQMNENNSKDEFDIISALQTPAQISLPSRSFHDPPNDDDGEFNGEDDLRRREKAVQLTRLLAKQSMTDYSGGVERNNLESRSGEMMGVGGGMRNQGVYGERFGGEKSGRWMDGSGMNDVEMMGRRFGDGGLMGGNERMGVGKMGSGEIGGGGMMMSGGMVGDEMRLRAEEERQRRQEVLNVKGELARQASFKARNERRNRR